MTTRRRWHISVLAAAALIVAGCGGGSTDSPVVSRVVSFGDSLSDSGTYTPVTRIDIGQPANTAPFLAGKFTTNAHTGYTPTNNTNVSNTWVEWVSARLGLPITPAVLGFATTRVPCPAAANPALADSCTAYGQGGSRVTNAAGWKSEQGFLADPLSKQVAAHIARFGGFKSTEIVFLWTGGNDFLVQGRDLEQGLIDPTVAVANMATAGTELATLIKDQVLANGASRVVAMTLPNPTQSPDYASRPAPEKAFLTQMTDAYNGALLAGLSGTGVKIIDAAAWFADVVARPSAYGFANASNPSCDPAKMPAAAGGSALFCNTAPATTFTASGLPNLSALAAGANTSTWFWADGFHPSVGGHKAFGDFVWSKLKEFDWVPSNL